MIKENNFYNNFKQSKIVDRDEKIKQLEELYKIKMDEHIELKQQQKNDRLIKFKKKLKNNH
jgi:hypothetical protein